MLTLLIASLFATQPLTVAAAASMSEVLPQLAPLFEQREHAKLHFSFDASSRLAKQIEAGADIDVFISADGAWMDAVSSRIDTETRTNLVENTLVAVVPAGKPLPADAQALASLSRIAVAQENVPAGRYAEAALKSLGVWNEVQPKLLRGTHVRAVLQYVALREVDAGIVYQSDARSEPRVAVAFLVPATSHAPIRYPAAVVKRSQRVPLAKRFIAFLHTPEAQAVFAKAGFTRRSE